MLDRDLTRRRFDECASDWLRSFALTGLKVLVVCRGPVRQEAFDIFAAIGVREYGMLLSEKDSVTYARTLAPELRGFRFPGNVHRVPDYMGVGQEEKLARIGQIVAIACDHGYTHIFAGYGFMAEDAEFIAAVEAAGLGFMGPSSRVARGAGAKDEAKKLARSLGNAVITGIDDISAQALARRAESAKGLTRIAREHGLAFSPERSATLEANAEALLQLGYAATVELVSIAELQALAQELAAEIWAAHPGRRIRFKHIGGGGGKGQRVIAAPEQVATAVMDVLAESKVIEPGSNRNFLLELNIDSTRHNEIQLVGNGQWCVALGGRDCSVQMHEQKLLEVSLTQELLDTEIALAAPAAAEILRRDKSTLGRMELEGERFGAAVGLDSVSTFECIVDGFEHFFMEMNTRIQVEHAVTELAYRLRFANPDDSSEFFYCDELIEVMALLAAHGPRLPRPERVVRNVSGLEARINATNAALQPSAGGLIRAWSPPVEGEIRFDQGIGLRNPDTGGFVFYQLAGAYDSNVALVLTAGTSRRDNYERMAEVLRRTEMRGDDLNTNLSVHYGLVQWFLGRGVMAEPTTRFMQSYLAAVGALCSAADQVDLDVALAELMRRSGGGEARAILGAKETLLRRPLERILRDAHVLAGFLGRYDGELWFRDGAEIRFAVNPMLVLERLYHFLDLDDADGKPSSERIWSHDAAILDEALGFYADVEARTGLSTWAGIESMFASAQGATLCGNDEALWQACLAAHRGFQLGMEILLVLPRLGAHSEFLEVGVDKQLRPFFPARFTDPARMAEDVRALAPPPKASADEIVTPMGGTFYAREAPHLPPLVEEGQHFAAGQPLFVIEVMKMFNKISVPFAGTVTGNLMDGCDGKVVRKGQPVFAITPDERREEIPEAEITARRRAATLALLAGGEIH